MARGGIKRQGLRFLGMNGVPKPLIVDHLWEFSWTTWLWLLQSRSESYIASVITLLYMTAEWLACLQPLSRPSDRCSHRTVVAVKFALLFQSVRQLRFDTHQSVRSLATVATRITTTLVHIRLRRIPLQQGYILQQGVRKSKASFLGYHRLNARFHSVLVPKCLSVLATGTFNTTNTGACPGSMGVTSLRRWSVPELCCFHPSSFFMQVEALEPGRGSPGRGSCYHKTLLMQERVNTGHVGEGSNPSIARRGP